MKPIVLTVSMFLLLFSSCVKQRTPEVSLNDAVDTTAKQKYTGVFVNGPWGRVSGKAIISQAYNGQYSLILDSVTISNGPDLYVYLSKEVQPVNFISLGKLKATMGTQVYAINGMPDFSEYKYALIHCQQYNHLFGSALLMMP